MVGQASLGMLMRSLGLINPAVQENADSCREQVLTQWDLQFSWPVSFQSIISKVFLMYYTASMSPQLSGLLRWTQPTELWVLSKVPGLSLLPLLCRERRKAVCMQCLASCCRGAAWPRRLGSCDSTRHAPVHPSFAPSPLLSLRTKKDRLLWHDTISCQGSNRA